MLANKAFNSSSLILLLWLSHKITKSNDLNNKTNMKVNKEYIKGNKGENNKRINKELRLMLKFNKKKHISLIKHAFLIFY